MVKETFWKSGLAPKALVICCALTMGDDIAGNDAVSEICSSRLSAERGLAAGVLEGLLSALLALNSGWL
jgi:uncharacterized membrane protein YcjF (UPF0283 family)